MELQRRAPEGVIVQSFGREDADFFEPEQVREVARSLDADAVINAVAYTDVDKAESEPERAELVNSTSVGTLAQACAQQGRPLVHISTDYVFPGIGNVPWSPGDATGPLGVYGASKLAGEQRIAANPDAPMAILRTSWVFSAHGSNFVKTMLRLGAEREELSIVSDQVGGPTAAADIADACFAIARGLTQGNPGGIYHFSGAPDVSWADFAREIFTQSGLSCEVADIPTSQYPTPARRPLNSRLDCSAMQSNFDIPRPDWRLSLQSVLQELGQ